MSKKLPFVLLISAFMLVAASCNQTKPAPTPASVNYKTGTMTIGGKMLNVQIADTDALRAQGLSDRDILGVNDGMIFVFEAPDQYAFWMKDMRFPLDFIWIKEGRVTQITPNVPVQLNVSEEDLATYLPANPINSMLEVNAGWAAANNIKVGDAVVDQF